MTETERFNRITEDKLCIGCGLCQSLLGDDKIKIQKVSSGDQKGELRPTVISLLTKADTDLVYATCPSTRCESNPSELTDLAPHNDSVWGAYHRLALGWAGHPNTRFEGSTAGVLTALGCYLLKSKRVSFIMHVKPHSLEPTFGEATLSFTEADVLAAVGSRYGPTAPLINLDEVLSRNEPFAVIAKPCDLNALRKSSFSMSSKNYYVVFGLLITPDHRLDCLPWQGVVVCTFIACPVCADEAFWKKWFIIFNSAENS